MATLPPMGGAPKINAPAVTADPISPKEAFVGAAGKKVDLKKKRPQAKKLSDPSGRFIKIGLYGGSGSGKTYGLVDLICKYDQKLFVLSTDFGGDGLSTVVAELKERGLGHLADTNVTGVTLSSYEEVIEFTEKPELYCADIYDLGIDFLVWDGFSGFQQYQVSEYVDTLGTIYDSQGNLNTQKYWGEIKAASSRPFNRFMYMHNKKDGKLWHKYLTMLVDDKAKEEALAATTNPADRAKVPKDQKAPFVQGGAAKLIEPAFDFFALTTTRSIPDPKETGKRTTEFVYKVTASDKQKAKVRGVKFDPIIPANMGDVWARLVEAYLVNPGQVSEEVKEA